MLPLAVLPKQRLRRAHTASRAGPHAAGQPHGLHARAEVLAAVHSGCHARPLGLPKGQNMCQVGRQPNEDHAVR